MSKGWKLYSYLMGAVIGGSLGISLPTLGFGFYATMAIIAAFSVCSIVGSHRMDKAWEACLEDALYKMALDYETKLQEFRQLFTKPVSKVNLRQKDGSSCAFEVRRVGVPESVAG